MHISEHGWLAGNNVNQAAQHFGMLALLISIVFVIAFIEHGSGIYDDQTEFAAEACASALSFGVIWEILKTPSTK
jgi:hypothetical protein